MTTTIFDIFREIQSGDQSLSMARRLVIERAVTINDISIDHFDEIEISEGDLLRVGKRNFWRFVDGKWNSVTVGESVDMDMGSMPPHVRSYCDGLENDKTS